MSNDQLGAALLDVRKAHRLLHSYNKRILDIAKTIDEVLEDYEFWAYDTYPAPFKWKPSRWNKKQDVWGALPFIQPCFYWKKPQDSPSASNEARVFVASVWTDSGFESDDENPREWPTPEESSTTIDFWLARPTTNAPLSDARHIFDDLRDTSKLLPLKSESGDFISVYDSIDLERLKGKKDVEQTAREFLDKANSDLTRV